MWRENADNEYEKDSINQGINTWTFSSVLFFHYHRSFYRLGFQVFARHDYNGCKSHFALFLAGAPKMWTFQTYPEWKHWHRLNANMTFKYEQKKVEHSRSANGLKFLNTTKTEKMSHRRKWYRKSCIVVVFPVFASVLMKLQGHCIRVYRMGASTEPLWLIPWTCPFNSYRLIMRNYKYSNRTQNVEKVPHFSWFAHLYTIHWGDSKHIAILKNREDKSFQSVCIRASRGTEEHKEEIEQNKVYRVNSSVVLDRSTEQMNAYSLFQ